MSDFTPNERAILDRWDAGKTKRQIVRETGFSANYVSTTLTRFCGGGEVINHRINMREGSAALLRALRAAA